MIGSETAYNSATVNRDRLAGGATPTLGLAPRLVYHVVGGSISL